MTYHDPTISAAEQRALPRERTLFAVGRLESAGRQYVCLVRNHSEAGVGIEVAARLTAGEQVSIEMRGLPRTVAEVRWSEDGKAGLQFTDDEFMRSSETGSSDGIVPRSPRFDLDTEVEVLLEDGWVQARAIDIALGGIKLHASAAAVGTPATIRIGDDMELRGRICWIAERESGLRFATPLSSRELASIVDTLQPASR